MIWFVSSTNMLELKSEKPAESPAGSDPVSRLVARLLEEGFTSDQDEGEWEEFGEIIYRRNEKISFASGETIFIFTRVPDLTERVLRQASESVVKTWEARNAAEKALSVLQSTTVYHCLVSPGDQPHNDSLGKYVTRSGGATFLPIVIVPEINQLLYPAAEKTLRSIKPRIQYLRYLIGERREPVDMHRPTLQAIWVSMGVIVLLLLAIVIAIAR
jgi:hypothetical protein